MRGGSAELRGNGQGRRGDGAGAWTADAGIPVVAQPAEGLPVQVVHASRDTGIT